MDKISNLLKQIGILCISLGVLSFILSFFHLNLKILVWMDMWGNAVGMMLRFGFIVVGVICLVIVKMRGSHGT